MIVCGLAGWRAASMFATESGPWHIFDILREHLGIRPMVELGFWAELVSCVWCLGFWAAWWMLGMFALGLGVVPQLFAAAAVVVIVERHVRP